MRLRGLASAALALAAVLSALQGCGVGTDLDRDPATVDGIRVDSVRILPLGSRFVLADSATRLAFRRFHAGYACSRVLEMGLAAQGSGDPAVFAPKTSVRLPGSEDCALDTAGRDTAITFVFGAGPAGVRLTNSAGKATDSAAVARGKIAFDSLQGKFSPLTHTFSLGLFTVRDSSGGKPRVLFADSLTPCQSLNHANFTAKADTSLLIRYSLIGRDSTAAADTCHGGTHRDSIPVLPADSLSLKASR